MTTHLISILTSISISITQNVLFWPVHRREDALSINCAINCTLLKAMPNVQLFLNFVNWGLAYALLDKAVNK